MNHYEIQEYIIRNRPAAAYLGRLEMRAMEVEAERNGWIRPDCFLGNSDLARMEFCGCPIFEVMSESHAGFGQNAKDVAVGRERHTAEAGNSTPT